MTYEYGIQGGPAQPVTVVNTENAVIYSGNKVAQVNVTPVLTVHATYVAGDYVGTSGAAFEIPGAARIAGGSGLILSTQLIDAIAASVAGELWLFDQAVTPPDDSAAWVLSDADMAHWIGTIPFNTYYANANNSGAQGDLSAQTYSFKCPAGATSIFGCYVTKGAPGYNANVLTFRFLIILLD